MAVEHSTPATLASKPAKPRPDFPLFAHAAGVWAKKIRGKLHYFGPWNDPEGAEAKYNAEKDALHAGRKPRADLEAVTVKDAANNFLNAKRASVDAGELSERTFADYRLITALMVQQVGKSRLVVDLDSADFAALRRKMTSRWGPHRILKLVQYVRSVFKHAWETGLISAPVRFGPDFKRPSKKTLRQNRAKRDVQLFTAEEIRRMLDAAGTPLRAMILLGINCGFGNADCGSLPLSALNLDAAMIDYPRPKNGIARRCPIWPETVAAIGEALAVRPTPKRDDDAALAFVTKYGKPWSRDDDPAIITKEMVKLLRKLGINGSRSFYTLRHTFRTVADEAHDQPACDLIMGHEVPHMSSHYREKIGNDRLRAVAVHVRDWLFPAQSGK
jgi:integrase